MQRLVLCTIVAVVLAMLGACSLWNDGVVIPAAEQVSEVTFRAPDVNRTIDDRESIEEVLGVLHQLNHGWRTYYVTMPAPDGFLDLKLRGGENSIYFTLGASWLSTRDKMASADTEKMQKLRRLLTGR